MAPPHPQDRTQANVRAGRPRAEVAVAERLLAAARAGADVRTRKVRRLRAAIKVKAYENDLKLAVAVENMLAAIRETSPPPPPPLARQARAGSAGNPKPEARNPKQFQIPKRK